MYRLAKVEPGGLAHPVDCRGAALAEIDLVEIALEDRLLLVTGLHDQRHRGFLELALETAFRGQEEVLDQLLRQCAAALANPTGAEVDPQGPDDAAEIDPAVREEALILDGEDRVDQVLRHTSHANQLPLLVIGSVVGTHQLRLQQQSTELAAGPGIAELLDGRPAESQDDVAGRLGTAGVIEGAAVQPDPPALPAEVSRRAGHRHPSISR